MATTCWEQISTATGYRGENPGGETGDSWQDTTVSETTSMDARIQDTRDDSQQRGRVLGAVIRSFAEDKIRENEEARELAHQSPKSYLFDMWGTPYHL